MRPPLPVLRALAWRLVDAQIVAREAWLGDGEERERAWVCRRLSEGVHGLPFQLARDASDEAFRLEPEPLQGLSILAKACLRMEQGVPRVADEACWDAVCRIVDPELLALAHPEIRALDPCGLHTQDRLCWPPVLRAQHTAFHAVCDGALTEIHAHVGGSMPNNLLWAGLLYGVAVLPALRPWRGELVGRSDWDSVAASARRCLTDLLQGRCGPAECRDDTPVEEHVFHQAMLSGVMFDDAVDVSAWPYVDAQIGGSTALALLLPERRALQRAFWQRERLAAAGRHADHHRDLTACLLTLVRQRCAFNVFFSQPPGHRGLLRFLEYNHRRDVLVPPGSGHSRAQRLHKHRVLALTFELLLETWLSDQMVLARGCEAVLDLELRTVLPLRGRAPADFFIAFAHGVSRVLRRHRCTAVRVGIVHHAIKRRERSDGQHAFEEFQRIWWLLRAVPELRPLLVGLDAASAELDCPPRSFSKAFLWIRDRLDNSACEDNGPPIHLGFTFHAGEDFRDLLTGIRHVDEAAHLLGMRAGDRIGHGLALSWPVDEFYLSRGQSFAKIGEHALDLCWAAALLGRHEGHGDLARDARERLLALLTAAGAQPMQPYEAIIAALDMDGPHTWCSPHAGALAHVQDAGDEVARALREDELLQRLGIPEKLRDDIAPTISRQRDWRKLVGACQRLAQQRLRERGLTIEINPSSNRLVGGFDTPERLPYTRISRPGPRQPDQPANIPLAIGTDDAGIFHTSLRREYDIVGQSALAQGYSLPDVQDWLTHIRDNGRSVGFLQRHGLQGAALLKHLDDLAVSPTYHRVADAVGNDADGADGEVDADADR
jgi:hypothetical protein